MEQGNGDAGRPASLLVVDDEEELLQIFADFLDGSGYTLELARTGTEAIEKLTGNRFDLVVTDINMPGADGLAVLRQAKAADPECEVIMLTGNASTATAIEALRRGAYDYVTKPFDLFEVDATIRKALERRRLLQENVRFVETLRQANLELTSSRDALRRHRDELKTMVEEATKRVRTLVEVGKEITSSLHLGRTLNLVLERSLELTGARQGALFLREDQGERLRSMVHQGDQGEDAAVLEQGLEELNRQVIAQRSPMIGRPFGENRAAGEVLVVPLLQEADVIGTVAVSAPDRSFSEDDQELLMSLGAQASIAIHNARVYGKIRDLERMKSEFVAIVSHEVRTPLTSIKGTLEILEDEKYFQLDAPQRELLGICQANAERLEVLINDILDFSKLESSRLSNHFTEVSLASMAGNVIVGISNLAGRKGLTITREIPPQIEPILADEMRISQVVSNLLSNAIKFSPAGGEIELRVHEQGEGVVVSVRDQGIGISAEDLPKLFTRFRQLDSSSTREAGGTGLGLVISKGIVEEHGGRIWVESKPGAGSCFSFWLPRKASDIRNFRDVPGESGVSIAA